MSSLNEPSIRRNEGLSMSARKPSMNRAEKSDPSELTVGSLKQNSEKSETSSDRRSGSWDATAFAASAKNIASSGFRLFMASPQERKQLPPRNVGDPPLLCRSRGDAMKEG